VNVVDSSAWIEYFVGGPNADDFSVPIERTDELVVPALTVYEVFKRVHQVADESRALHAAGLMMEGMVVELSASLAIAAARLSLDTRLSMADSIILATARSKNAVLWTQDAHFKGLDRVEYRGPA
jgi:predicted nucleic acid-binding protein